MTRGSISHTYDYIPACSLHPNYQGHQLVLTMRQQPVQARVSTNNERDRKPIEPPPIIQIQLNHAASSQELQDFLQNPYFFMYVNLVNPVSKELVHQPDYQILSGQTVSSMYKLKDVTDQDGGFFCFGDLSSRIQGEYQLKFSLFEIVTDGIINLMHTFSNVFKVYNSKTMPGLIDATFLSRSFSDQGVRIRIRKEHRVQVANSKKRKLSAEELEDQQAAQSPPPYERTSRRSSVKSQLLTTTLSASILPTNASTSHYIGESTHGRKKLNDEYRTSDDNLQPPTLIYPNHAYSNNDNDFNHAHSFSLAPHPYDLRSRQNSLVQQPQPQPQPLLHVQSHLVHAHAHIHDHHYNEHSGPTSNTMSPPSMKIDQQQRYRRQSIDDKIMFPLSPRPSVSSIDTTRTPSSDFDRRRRSTASSESPQEGWIYLHNPSSTYCHAVGQQMPFQSTSSIKPPPSPANTSIRLPPLHTMIPNADAKDNSHHHKHGRYNRGCDDDKGDVGHVNAAVAMMQLSQHRQMDANTAKEADHRSQYQHQPRHHGDGGLQDPSTRLSTETLDR